MEEWKDVKGYEGLYKISNKGIVINNRGIPIKAKDNGKGYLRFNLSKGNRNYSTVYLHRVIAEAFIPNPNNYPEVNHIDEDKQNNKISNLEWCSIRYNRLYGTRIKRYSEKNKKKIIGTNIENKKTIYLDGVIDCIQYGFNKSAISNCLQGLSKSSGGYMWSYA